MAFGFDSTMNGNSGGMSWDAFRQSQINDFNSNLTNRPDLQAAGVKPMTFTPGNYGASQPQTAAAPVQPFSFSTNPYLPDQANAMRAQQSQLFGDMNQAIRGGAVATGGYGGSRMGVAQGVAMGRAATGLDSALAGMFGNAYDADQTRGLQQYVADQNFYQGQRGQDLQQAGLGAELYGLAQQGQWAPLTNWANVLKPFTGAETTTSSSGGGWQGGLGGLMSGLSFADKLGLFGQGGK